MFQQVWSTISRALGLELQNQDLTIWQMSLRAFVIFIAAIAMIRFADKRFMGKHTSLDVLLGIVFGSVLSRAITGNAPFFPTLAAALTLVLSHWIMSAWAFRSKRFSRFLKGRDHALIKDGEIQWPAMKKGHISEDDLREAMRIRGKEPQLREVESAHLERDGEISIVTRPRR